MASKKKSSGASRAKNPVVGHVTRKKGKMYYVDGSGAVREATLKGKHK